MAAESITRAQLLLQYYSALGTFNDEHLGSTARAHDSDLEPIRQTVCFSVGSARRATIAGVLNREVQSSITSSAAL